MPNLASASINVSSSGENTAVSGVSGLRIRVHRLVLVNSVATAQTVTVKDAASGNTLGIFPLPSSIGGGIALDAGHGPALFTSADSGAFILSLSAATAVNGMVQYVIS